MQRSPALRSAHSLLDHWQWIAGGLAAGAAIAALGLWVTGGSGASVHDARNEPAAVADAASADGSPAELVALRLALAREVEAREQLGLEVTALREQLERAGGPGAPTGSSGRAAERPPAQRPLFDRDGLVAAGVSPDEAQELRSRWEALELEKIRLSDRATREGWVGTAQHQQALRALDDDSRGQLSDSDYDRYLYATGKPNRARVTDVLARSPADDAGFQPGDTILSYGGERVYSIEELRQRATQSRAGASIRIEVMRGGDTVSMHVPGGPLGLMLSSERQAPR